MIKLTKLNSQQLVLNSDLIEFIEETPDAVISLTTGNKIVVKETVDEIVEKVVEYKRRINSGIIEVLRAEGVKVGD